MSKQDLAQQALESLVEDGWTNEQAAGVIANIEAESSFDSEAVGDGGTAFGICQWHPDRQRAFQNQFGFGIMSSTYEQQLKFITFEMNNGERQAGDALRQSTSATDAGEVVCALYERPLDRNGSVRRARGERAQFWFQTLSAANVA